jgi:glutamate dehydrogenase (NAD(P)+)
MTTKPLDIALLSDAAPEMHMTKAVVTYFDRAADLLKLNANHRAILTLPGREFCVNLPVHLDNGEIHVFPSYRVQHHVAMGPMQGGLRYLPDITLDEMRALALLATFTSSVANVPFGGSMGGIVCDPKQLSLGELERLTRRYVSEMLDILGTERDVLAPDLSTDQQVMAWIMDTYSMHARHTVTAIVTGKPVELGGSHGSREAIGYGVMCILNEYVKAAGRKPEDTRVAIQGAGRRGGAAAALLYAEGYKVVAIADFGGGLYRPDGLDIPDVLAHFARNNTLEGYPNAEVINDEELLTIDCDILVPAFRQHQITTHNADKLRCRTVCEAAYGATTLAATDILADRGVTVIPAIMGEAGGVTVRYFEWVQNRMGFRWRKDVVMERLRDKVTTMYHDVAATAEQHGVNLREAAYTLGLQRMERDLALRGVYA